MNRIPETKTLGVRRSTRFEVNIIQDKRIPGKTLLQDFINLGI